MNTLIELNQQWYFYSLNEYFLISKITKDIYLTDGVFQEKVISVVLKSSKGSVITRFPEDFNEYHCKLVKDNDFIIKEPANSSRLEKID